MNRKLKEIFKPAVLTALGLTMLGAAWLKWFAVPGWYMMVAALFVVAGSGYYLGEQIRRLF